MPPARALTSKPSFLNAVLALPPKEMAQVQSKLAALLTDPVPDGHTRKWLEGADGGLCRLRCGDYRIFYTFDDGYVSVLDIRRRGKHTYSGALHGENLGGPAVLAEVPAEYGGGGEGAAHWDRWLDSGAAGTSSVGTPLSQPITEALLSALRIPEDHHPALLALHTEDDLLDCDAVPDALRGRVLDALCGRPLEEIARQPDLVVADAGDLIRYKEGELLGFLLKLNPEQEKYVRWAVSAKGPTLLKGGPGTGKSTVALYRVRVFLEALKAAGIERPNILFTTYTRALTRFSEQLLQSLLGPGEAEHVHVQTADQVAMKLARRGGGEIRPVTHKELKALLAEAVAEVDLYGNALQIAAQRQTLARLGAAYLLEEVQGVIEARGLTSLQAYQTAARPGRKVPLGATQREAVWRVREKLIQKLAAAGKQSWEQIRALALSEAEAGRGPRYDAILVDEVQDLQPLSIRLLVNLCADPGRLFLTADANQSIYGGGFRWTEIHGTLRFVGRTGVLKANHRSTREIGEAAQSYLSGGSIDDEPVERLYVNSGPLPAVRQVADEAAEARLLARFFRSASRELRLGLGACAALVPYRDGTKRLAEALRAEGIEATAMTGGDLDLGRRGVKVLTLKSAKGLEFPIVAVAGFGGGYPPHLDETTDEQRDEILGRERRTLFVAMTRAMRALLVVTPAAGGSEVLEGFEAGVWNTGDRV